jgi:hypothetical protein
MGEVLAVSILLPLKSVKRLQSAIAAESRR